MGPAPVTEPVRRPRVDRGRITHICSKSLPFGYGTRRPGAAGAGGARGSLRIPVRPRLRCRVPTSRTTTPFRKDRPRMPGQEWARPDRRIGPGPPGASGQVTIGTSGHVRHPRSWSA
ncbi:hypothetical protein GCM10009544_23660 [Streptomyces stramineus]|uniref:Uncharacterized protein n=1 Tax=Streptomyces stramineus TaxID=173861 RepID=A0ABP3JPP7_9ACTN